MGILDGTPGSGGILRFLVTCLVIAGAIGIVIVVINTAGIAIPSFVITIGWIVGAVFVGAMAIILLSRLINKVP